MAEMAIERAVEFAKSSGAEITFFHAQESFYARTDVALFGEGFAINPDLGESFAQANRERAETILKAATSQAEAAGVPCTSSTAIHPVVYEAILAATQRPTACCSNHSFGGGVRRRTSDLWLGPGPPVPRHLQPHGSIGTLVEIKISGLDHLAVIGRACTLGSIGRRASIAELAEPAPCQSVKESQDWIFLPLT